MNDRDQSPVRVGDAVRVGKDRGLVIALATSRSTGRELVQVALSPRVRIWFDRRDVIAL